MYMSFIGSEKTMRYRAMDPTGVLEHELSSTVARDLPENE
jgi:hypothetical protein